MGVSVSFAIFESLMLTVCESDSLAHSIRRHSRSDLAGIKFGDELKRIGYLGDTPASFEVNKLSAHFEVHIEQGPILEAENLPVAVVSAVQGKTQNVPRYCNISVYRHTLCISNELVQC